MISQKKRTKINIIFFDNRKQHNTEQKQKEDEINTSQQRTREEKPNHKSSMGSKSFDSSLFGFEQNQSTI